MTDFTALQILHKMTKSLINRKRSFWRNSMLVFIFRYLLWRLIIWIAFLCHLQRMTNWFFSYKPSIARSPLYCSHTFTVLVAHLGLKNEKKKLALVSWMNIFWIEYVPWATKMRNWQKYKVLIFYERLCLFYSRKTPDTFS